MELKRDNWEINVIKETSSVKKGKNKNRNKLEVLEIISENWNTTLDKNKLQVLLNMYASTGYDPDSIKFDDKITQMDTEN